MSIIILVVKIKIAEVNVNIPESEDELPHGGIISGQSTLHVHYFL